MKKNLFLILISVMCSVSVWAQSISITGKVVDEKNQPLIGASVLVKGTTNGTVADIDGQFTLNVPEGAILEVSSIGFVSKTLPVGNQRTFEIVLAEDTELIEATVVVGYGTVKRTNFTGSVATYNVGDSPVANVPKTNALEMLRGLAPGVQMGQSGIAGASPSIQVRGQKSIAGGSDPLIVLDGVIFKGKINDIDPTTIESMSVMKDATSLASYGSQAANGVIMITSKKGDLGKPMINFRSSISLVGQNYTPELKSGAKYLDMINARLGNPAGTTSWMSELEKANLAAGEETDWIDYVTQLGVQQEYSANISGGSQGFNYMFGVARSDNKNFMKGNQFIRNTVTARLNSKINNYISAGLNFNWADMRDDGIRLSYTRFFSPYGEPTLEDGSVRKYIIGANQETATNPLWATESGSVDAEYRGTATTIGGNIEIKFPWIKGLSYKMTGNYTLRDFNTSRFYHEKYHINQTETEFTTAVYDKYLANANGYINTNKTIGWVLDNILTYTREFNDHYINATLVYTRDSNLSTGHNISGSDFAAIGNTTLGFWGLTNATTQKIEDITYTLHNDVGYLARVNYSLKDKYHFNASIRRDGSSVFGMGKKWGNFPAIGAAWTISDESFMGETKGWLDYLKIKASWGMNGNQSLSPYETLSRMEMGVSGGHTGYFDGKPVFGQAMTTLGNPLLGWETTTSWNAGWEADLLGRRLHWEVDAYKSSTTDQIFSRKIPVMGSGITSQSATMGQVDNWGIESSLRANIMRKGDFRWDATLNFTMNRNKLVELYGDGKDDITNGLFIGESLGAIYGYQWDGIVQKDDVDFMKANGRTPGDVKEKDLDGDGKITPEDRTILGFGKEAFRMSLSTNLTWKNWTLYMMFNGSFSGGRYGKALNNNAHRPYTEGMMYLNTIDIPWYTEENPTNEYTKAWNATGSLYAIHNYGFIRLQDVSLSYTLSAKWMNKVKINSAQFYVSGNNLFFIAPDWKYSDPEVRSFQSQQLRRTVTFGVNVRF